MVRPAKFKVLAKFSGTGDIVRWTRSSGDTF